MRGAISRKSALLWLLVVLLLLGLALAVWSPAIFQRGNPLPYIAAAIRISEQQPYVQVNDGDTTYISKLGICPALFSYVEQTYDVQYVEQMGSAHLFAGEDRNVIVQSQVYWSRYTVWDINETSK